MSEAILGIDVSKKELSFALLCHGKCHKKKLANTLQGFMSLSEWLKDKGVNKVKACLEATGSYGENIADFLYQQGHQVHVVNPACIKAFSRSKLSRHKTDEADALLIAEYARQNTLRAYTPRPPQLKKLRALYRSSQALKLQYTQTLNFLENEERLPSSVKGSYKRILRALEKELKCIEDEMDKILAHDEALSTDYNNLQSIPGIGKITAMAILAEAPDINSLQSARQLAAYAGLTPTHKTSGTSLRGKSRLSKMGSSSLRKALFFPAIVAKNYNPLFTEFTLKLAQKGKPKMVIVGAIMRKLLHVIFGVLKHKMPFNPLILKNK